MKPKTSTVSAIAETKIIGPIYVLLFFIMALTGFAQMPIFKRYYIADIPGLGWTAQYYVTHTIHYLGAAVLLFLVVYALVVYWGLLRRHYSLTLTACLRIALLGGIVITGIFRVLKNLPDVVFSPGFTMFIDIAHLGLMMIYMLVALAALVIRGKWLKAIPAMDRLQR